MRGRFLLDPPDFKEIKEIIRKIEAKNQETKYGEVFPTNTVLLKESLENDCWFNN